MAASFTVEVDDKDALVHFGQFDAKVRAALLTAEEALERSLAAKVRARSPVKTGAFLGSIDGDVRASARGVIGEVWAGVAYAHILEGGAELPARDILPDAAQALHFMEGAREVFAKIVHWPGATIKPEHILGGALAEMQDEILTTIEETIDRTVSSEWL